MSKLEQEASDWMWHRKSKSCKSHLVQARSIVFRDGHRDFASGCGRYIRIGSVSELAEANNDMSDPCKRCLQLAAAKKA